MFDERIFMEKEMFLSMDLLEVRSICKTYGEGGRAYLRQGLY